MLRQTLFIAKKQDESACLMDILCGFGCYGAMENVLPSAQAPSSHWWNASGKWVWSIVLVMTLALVLMARIYFGIWLLHYVNHSLQNIKGYEGSVEAIDLHLYRGAYKIRNLKIFKKVGHIPTPFIAIEDTDLSLQWGALFHGRIVAKAHLYKPVLNFAVAKSGAVTQTGVETDWTKTIRDLMPLDINLVTFEQGKLTYQDFSKSSKVDIYIHQMKGDAHNLRNVVDKTQPLPSRIIIDGNSIGGGKLRIDGKMNILKRIPDMDLDTQLENVNLPALSNYSNAYASVDIRKGSLSVYSELIVKDNRVSGYIKPIATNIALIDLHKDANPIKIVWQSVVAVVLEIFTNHHHEQFATKIKLDGRLDNVGTDTWTTIGGIIHNAFVSAFKKGIDNETPRPKSFTSKPQ